MVINGGKSNEQSNKREKLYGNKESGASALRGASQRTGKKGRPGGNCSFEK
jgi:hypothetical protein